MRLNGATDGFNLFPETPATSSTPPLTLNSLQLDGQPV